MSFGAMQSFFLLCLVVRMSALFVQDKRLLTFETTKPTRAFQALTYGRAFLLHASHRAHGLPASNRLFRGGTPGSRWGRLRLIDTGWGSWEICATMRLDCNAQRTGKRSASQ